MNKAFLDEIIRLSFAIERTVASEPDNPHCRTARVLAEQIHELAERQIEQDRNSISLSICTKCLCANGEHSGNCSMKSITHRW